jgi:hypothetical protein
LLFGLLKIVICGMEMNLTLQKAVMAVPAWQGWFRKFIGDTPRKRLAGSGIEVERILKI